MKKIFIIITVLWSSISFSYANDQIELDPQVIQEYKTLVLRASQMNDMQIRQYLPI